MISNHFLSRKSCRFASPPWFVARAAFVAFFDTSFSGCCVSVCPLAALIFRMLSPASAIL
jgi:hypothetical protein